MGGYAPYGYVLHPEIRNKLKLDPEAAEVVRRVFDEALEGRNTSQIALSLNDDNISTPGQYFKDKHPDKKKYSRMSEKISWTASMVYKILTSYVYTGATVGHKRKSGGVGSRKTISQKKEDWIIVEGMHEAIVSKEEFELAQAVIRGGEKNPNGICAIIPSRGLVCCGNCKRALTRRKLRNESGYFYQCTHSTHDRDTDCSVGERYSEAWIEDTAYKAIGQMLTLVEKKAVKEHEISKRRKSAISECADAIRDLQKQYEQLKAVKLRRMRNTLPAASQRPNISSGKQKQTRRCLRMKKQSSEVISGCRSLILNIPVRMKGLMRCSANTRKAKGLHTSLLML